MIDYSQLTYFDIIQNGIMLGLALAAFIIILNNSNRRS